MTDLLGESGRLERDATGSTPALVFLNPKSSHNVGRAVRLASCFGINQVWYTGERINADIEKLGRLPREERMKDYRDVALINHERPLERFRSGVPVAVEVRKGSESLFSFVHPRDPIYVFGPEDGSIDSGVVSLCHRFIVIPARHCINVADAAAIVLYDRMLKLWLAGQHDYVTPGEFEMRGIL